MWCQGTKITELIAKYAMVGYQNNSNINYAMQAY